MHIVLFTSRHSGRRQARPTQFCPLRCRLSHVHIRQPTRRKAPRDASRRPPRRAKRHLATRRKSPKQPSRKRRRRVADFTRRPGRLSATGHSRQCTARLSPSGALLTTPDGWRHSLRRQADACRRIALVPAAVAWQSKTFGTSAVDTMLKTIQNLSSPAMIFDILLHHEQ